MARFGDRDGPHSSEFLPVDAGDEARWKPSAFSKCSPGTGKRVEHGTGVLPLEPKPGSVRCVAWASLELTTHWINVDQQAGSSLVHHWPTSRPPGWVNQSVSWFHDPAYIPMELHEDRVLYVSTKPFSGWLGNTCDKWVCPESNNGSMSIYCPQRPSVSFTTFPCLISACLFEICCPVPWHPPKKKYGKSKRTDRAKCWTRAHPHPSHSDAVRQVHAQDNISDSSQG